MNPVTKGAFKRSKLFSLDRGEDGVDQKECHQDDGPDQGELGAGPQPEVRSLGSLDGIDFLGKWVVRPPRVPAHVLVGRELREERLLLLLLPPLPEVGPGLVPVGGHVLPWKKMQWFPQQSTRHFHSLTLQSPQFRDKVGECFEVRTFPVAAVVAIVLGRRRWRSPPGTV